MLQNPKKLSQQLQELADKGSPKEKERAIAALAAYRQGLALTKELGELRMKLGATSAETVR